MKRLVCVIWLFALYASVVLFAQNTELPRLAVVTFSTNDTTDQIKRDAITVRNLVESQMVGTRKYQIITRDDIDKLLENQKIQVSSISSAENLKKLQLQNISYIVTGSVDTMGDNYAITVRVLDVSSGQFSHSDNAFMSNAPQNLYNGINGLMTKFVAGMSVAGGTIVQGTVVNPTGISIEVKTDKGGDLYLQGEKIATLWDNDTYTIPIERPGTYSLRLVLINETEKIISVTISARGVVKVDFSGIAPSAGGPGELFPLDGVILGKTTVQELASLGTKHTINTSTYYVINGINVWCHDVKRGVADGYYISHFDTMPKKWQESGFSWERSYNGWIELANKYGWEVKVKKSPTIEKYRGHDSFTADLELTCLQNGIQCVIQLAFCFSNGTSVNATNTLYSLGVIVR